ncbi:MAG: hypothetical protein WD708_06455 [Kiritimatiellia bacterium]
MGAALPAPETSSTKRYQPQKGTIKTPPLKPRFGKKTGEISNVYGTLLKKIFPFQSGVIGVEIFAPFCGKKYNLFSVILFSSTLHLFQNKYPKISM